MPDVSVMARLEELNELEWRLRQQVSPSEVLLDHIAKERARLCSQDSRNDSVSKRIRPRDGNLI